MPNTDSTLTWNDDRTPLGTDPNSLRLALSVYEELGMKVVEEARHTDDGECLHCWAINTMADVRRMASGLSQAERAAMAPPVPFGRAKPRLTIVE